MKTVKYKEMQNNLEKIFSMIKDGEEIYIGSDKSKEILAILKPYPKFQSKPKRKLGILKGIAEFKIKENFKMTDEELLSA